MLPKEPNYIIAIGASAGGMDEINTFFDHTPMDGVAYVIVQHLSADFKSRMVELLSRHSKLEVKEAGNQMIVESNCVYLIPNDKFMTISGGRLYLTEKEKIRGVSLTIDRFFLSLAIDCGRKSIGIILSGLGYDGTEGIIAIKKAGGMVIARNPEGREYANMPTSVIATGMVDFVLEPEAMPDTIEAYVKLEGDLMAYNKEDENDIKQIVELIRESLPLDFSDYKESTILRRTKRRASNCNCPTLKIYLDHLRKSPEEVAALAKDFLISVTSFFRDKEAFDIIASDIIPSILTRLTPGEELKMWVAGCATGEEVYSLAILVCEQLTGEFKDTVVKIFATDIDNTALTHAGKGIYGSGITKHVSPERLEKFFVKMGENYRVKTDIRKMVLFAYHDLVKNPPYCNMQFISCRNLLIYMTPVLQKKIFSMLLFGLKKDGYLFLGSSESPMPIIKNLEVVDKKWKIYKNLEAKREIKFDAFSLPEFSDAKRSPSRFLFEDTSNNISNNLSDAISESLVKDRHSLVVCIDENNQVVKSYGDTSKFLLQKNFSSNLIEVLPKPLSVALNILSADVFKTGESASRNAIKFKTGGAVTTVDMSVRALTVKKEQRLLMITLTEVITTDETGDYVFDERIYFDKYTDSLEEQVKELQEKLQSTYDLLDASNENMQSFNEELLSSNEEMQSTNEEMQSVNEELDTINTNYQIKNKELVELNDELNNYFRSNINGQLIINNNLELIRFSPSAVKQINLVETDIGRPLSNISTNIKFETIVDDIKFVIEKGGVVLKEIQTNNNKWYQVMTMPYLLQADNMRSGAIVTFNDISNLKITEAELERKNKSLLRINADLDNFVHTASHDLLAPLGNIETSIEVINDMKTGDPDSREYLSIINQSIKKFRALINEIAAVAKIESYSIAMEMVDLDEILDNIMWSLDNKIRSSGAVIKKELEVKEILFSKKNLRSILYNLISNGIKFKEDGSPLITIITSKKDGYVLLSVEDNGVGISKPGIDKIFDLYGRLRHNVEGQGIGLYLTRKIVDAAGGTIAVESIPGEGSKFTLLFKEPEVATVETSLN